MIVTISGPPGSGTSTVVKLLSEMTGYAVLSAGDTFRAMAGERGMSLADFGALCESDASVDRELDARMTAEARKAGDLILEGRLAGYNCYRGKVDALKVYVTASLEERARRVIQREGKPLEQVMEEIDTREKCEWKRYHDYYDIDILDTSIYDMVIDSSEIPAKEVAAEIRARLDC